MLRIYASLILLCLASMTQADSLRPFQATYTADWKQLPFTGKAERSLSLTDADTWLLSFEASMLVAGLTENSTFTLVDGRLHPLTYDYERTGLGKPKVIRHRFDWKANTVTGNEKKRQINLPLLAGVLDKSSYQLALQRDLAAGEDTLSYMVLDGRDIDTYDFRVLGTEVLTTPLGTFNTVKVERVRDPTQTKRKTVLWFATDWDFLLVQLNQVETDGKEYTILLEEGSVDGKPVSGRK